MSYLSPVDASAVYFEPLGTDEDDRPRCEPDDDRGRDRYDGDRSGEMRTDLRERSDRLEDARERFERFREAGLDRDDRCGDRDDTARLERFERFEGSRLENQPGPHPLPRL